MCTASCRDLTSAPEGNTSSCFRPLIAVMDFLLMDVQRINSERANSRLPSPTAALLLLYKSSAEGGVKKKIIKRKKKSKVHLVTQTLVLTIGLPVWDW